MSRRTLLFIPLLTLAVLLAACGNSGTSSSSSSSSSSSTGSAAIKTATATINGTSQTILTNTQGMTLYYFKPDTATTAACTGGCVSTWPPLLLQGSGTPTSATSLSGALSAVNAGNGMQIEYNGHPLYIFSGDSSAGQTNGEGVGGQWFVATPDLQSQGIQPTTPTPASSKYGY